MSTPNVLYINTHDTGQHFGCYGVATVHTPRIDALAAEGVKLTRMFAASSICSPSRGALLTGKWPQSNGLVGLAGLDGPLCSLKDPKQHLASILRSNGYRTLLFGIQHETPRPAELGFDEVHSARGQGAERRRSAVDTASEAAAFLRARGREGGRPFYLQVGFFETHTPYGFADCQPDREHGLHVPDYCLSENQPADDALKDHVAALQGSVRRVDEGVGILLDALAEAGLADDTLVLFTTDHGPELPRAKWTMFDPGLRVAFLLRWPGGGLTGGRTCEQMLSNIDWLPTLAELTGVEIPSDVEGASFAPCLRAPSAPSPREELFAVFIYGGQYCARTERYKLVRNFLHHRSNVGRFHEVVPAAPAELYDLAVDPDERNDVVHDPAYADALADMNARMWRWLLSVDASVLKGPSPLSAYRMAVHDYERRAGNIDLSMADALVEKRIDGTRYSASTDRYRIVRDFDPRNVGGRWKAVELYDLAADPDQKRDLSDDPACAEALEEMNHRLWAWLSAEDAAVLHAPPRTAAYEAAMADFERYRPNR